jgi:hypothetical protein
VLGPLEFAREIVREVRRVGERLLLQDAIHCADQRDEVVHAALAVGSVHARILATPLSLV